ncbi:MAG: N-acetyltransferase [Coriobacteriales bacterium]|jgi:putative acetyltransferase|nr:N-acetyltransferase [Coriobacteriales bacterium]
MNIRQETEGDFGEVYALIKTAFETAAVSDGDEQEYYARIRRSDACIPELSLVAEQDGRIIGHIMLARTFVHSEAAEHAFLVLAILSVAEDYRRSGVGSALARAALERATRLGYRAVFLAGDHRYYGRFGFVPASTYGIRYKEDVPKEMIDNIVALELRPGSLDGIEGVVDL